MDFHLNGIPNPLREAMLQAYCVRLAMTLDALLALGFAFDGKTYTFKELYAALSIYNWSEYFTREAIRYLFVGYQKNPTGRPSQLFSMQTLAYWAGVFKVNTRASNYTISDGLREIDLMTPKNYRMALYREHIARSSIRGGGIVLPRSLLSERLNLSRCATIAYDKELGTSVTQSLITENVLETRQDIYKQFNDHPENDHSRYLEIFTQAQPTNLHDMIAYHEGNFRVYSYKTPYIASIAFKAIDKGQSVAVVKQSFNRYSLPCYTCQKDDSYRGYHFDMAKSRKHFNNPYSVSYHDSVTPFCDDLPY